MSTNGKKKRFLRYRITSCWGLIEDTNDVEVRSYADGSIRRFRYVHKGDFRPERVLEAKRTPSEYEWTAFFDALSELGVWGWDTASIEPADDYASWSLRIEHGERVLRVEGAGPAPNSGKFDAAIARLEDPGTCRVD